MCTVVQCFQEPFGIFQLRWSEREAGELSFHYRHYSLCNCAALDIKMTLKIFNNAFQNKIAIRLYQKVESVVVKGMQYLKA